jgi:asparagine synthase (glutamine-hydrolysing)
VLGRLEGMFAFAIWDGVAGRLFCARDRLGIKPFYYARRPHVFVFASEIKALLACDAVPPGPDDEAVLAYLVQSSCDYAERTVFKHVQALPAGHALVLDAATGDQQVWKYWELKPQAAPESRVDDAARIGQLRRMLVQSTRKHLISDVRVGSCLSGGLDSSTVVSLIGKIRREDPEAASAIGDELFTFTSCYEQRAFDEREYALTVARAAGARSHLVYPSAADFWDDFSRMAWHQDMPFGGLSYYAQWRVMREARGAGVKVLLDGQGGDEIFGGYAKFRYAYLASLLRAGRLGRVTRELVRTAAQCDRYVLDLRNGYRYLPRALRRALNVDSLLRRALRADWATVVTAESTPATRWWRHASTGARRDDDMTLCQRVQVDDIVLDTLPQLLRMEDRSSMAFSLEARVPLLDHGLVEYGLGLPDRLKIQRGWSKFAVREAMRDLMPEDVRLRTSKLGFAAPDRQWIADDLRPQLRDLLNDTLRCGAYVDVQALRRWYDSPEGARANTESYLGLFRIVSLEMWMRAFQV